MKNLSFTLQTIFALCILSHAYSEDFTMDISTSSIALTWELYSIYPTEEEFNVDFEKVKELLSKQKEELQERILGSQEAGKLLRQLNAYVECLVAQDTSDQTAHVKTSEVSQWKAKYQGVLFSLGLQLAKLDDEEFQKFLRSDASLEEISFFLEELREHAQIKGSQEQEELVQGLISDGYHSFWSLYQTITGKIQVGEKNLSIGQAENLLTDPDKEVREQAFDDWNKAWVKEVDLLAQLLNHIAGFRLGVYEMRGWSDPLFEPLFLNRMRKETLDAMWKEVIRTKPILLKYLAHKAKLLGVEKLSWVDVEAPLYQTEEVPYSEACRTILEQFHRFHPRKAAFAKMALEKRWVEAEDRAGKAAGGFCVMFPKSKESRIFMTYTGTASNVATLAHELGHAYHNECLKDLPYFAQLAQMNVAETASTFGEMVVIDQAIEQAKSSQEKQQLLDDKLQRSVAYFCNLHARLLFEEAFYQERKKGFVSAERLCRLMEEAQKEAYGDSLSSYFPHFWAAKLHFYYTYFPFYNFPYTFGYLLSNGLYARAKGGDFSNQFDAFLGDTALMSVEDLASKHLQVDLTKPDFWKESLDVIEKDVELFCQIGD